jgi:hypothetical protein
MAAAATMVDRKDIVVVMVVISYNDSEIVLKSV